MFRLTARRCANASWKVINYQQLGRWYISPFTVTRQQIIGERLLCVSRGPPHITSPVGDGRQQTGCQNSRRHSHGTGLVLCLKLVAVTSVPRLRKTAVNSQQNSRIRDFRCQNSLKSVNFTEIFKIRKKFVEPFWNYGPIRLVESVVATDA